MTRATAGKAPALDETTLDFAVVLERAADDEGLRKTERTRLRLLASIAGQLAAGRESSELTVAAVTTGAGLAHGTFYRYFDDLRSATEILVEEFSRFVAARLAGAREGSSGSRERVRGATLLYTRVFKANPGLMRCLVGLGRDSAAYSRSYQRLNREWNLRMAAAIARHRAAAEEPRPAEAFLPRAYALGGLIDEFLTQLYLRNDPELAKLAGDEAAVADLLTELWWLGAYGEAPSGRLSG